MQKRKFKMSSCEVGEAKPVAEKAYQLGKDPSTKKLLDDIIKNLALIKEKELLENQVVN